MGDDKLDDLYQHAADLRLDVVWRCDLPEKRHGLYLDDRREIRLNYYCTKAQATAALAHEIGHYMYSDRCSTGLSERRADEFGAGLIISRDEYAAAERIVGHHPGALARELETTHRMVLAWRRWYARVPLAQRELA